MLYAQRIRALTSEPSGLHAKVLLRIVDAAGRVIPPGAFLPAAERFHLMARGEVIARSLGRDMPADGVRERVAI